ncbi:phytoene/squalene synthase family protein [Priestia filamentosa]|uniref:squalene/phytoene synthase family protein n=1 Tax=Priestia filamentosa TaxID=1402861 RepID=UPI0002D870A3|nr:phytoene/squalene synthase family protein [Priestia filamentosa]
MSENIRLHKDAIEMLKETSRTFFIPITYLSEGLKEAVGSAYLCMRAIDEIEDHPELEKKAKATLLRSVSSLLRKGVSKEELAKLFAPYQNILPEVTLRLADWIEYCPKNVVDQVLDATAIMGEGMADWALKDWEIKSEQDLDDYTYYVAGLVGVMLSDIWKWHSDIETDKDLAIGFGRGLQSVNILRNRSEDLQRGGIDFFPEGWEVADMFAYARRNLKLGEEYTKAIKPGPILDFCKIPLALAKATLQALEEGKEKMTRQDVNSVVNRVVE